MLEVPVSTGAELRAWRERLSWSQRQAAEWYGCGGNEWRRYERAEYLPLTVIRRVQDFEWVRAQGYSPTRGIPVKPP